MAPVHQPTHAHLLNLLNLLLINHRLFTVLRRRRLGAGGLHGAGEGRHDVEGLVLRHVGQLTGQRRRVARHIADQRLRLCRRRWIHLRVTSANVR